VKPEDFKITNYDKDKFEKTGILDVRGSVCLRDRQLTELPFKFGEILGDFYCSFNKLTSLKGCPIKVNGDFRCSFNQLTSLEFGPKDVMGEYSCSNNNLNSLKGSPKKISKCYDCSSNQLTSLKYGPSEIGGDFDCRRNKLTNLEFGPRIVGGNYDCTNNRLLSFEYKPTQVKGKITLYSNFFDIKSWIDILKKYPYTFRYCNLVPNNSSFEETIKGLKDKIEIIKMINQDVA
jgi:hypothetical protein